MEKQKERWKELCEQAAVENDPKKLMELVTEINRLLDEQTYRPNASKTDIDTSCIFQRKHGE